MKRFSNSLGLWLAGSGLAAIFIVAMALTLNTPAQVLKGSVVASPQWGGFQIERLTDELRLSTAQQAKIGPVLSEEQREIAEIRRKTAERIRKELNKEQQRQFDRTYGR